MKRIWAGLMMGCLAAHVAWADVGVAKPDPKDWVIVCPANAHPAYAHAAGELARRIKGMTGVDVPVKTDAEGGNAAVRFIVGGPDVNAAAMGVTVPQDLGDGYVLKSVEDAGGVRVVMAGLRGRSALYAVYGYLRRLCDCGFFRDGDYLPKRESIPVRGIDIVEKPVFPFREIFVFLFHYGPQAKYSSEWDFEQWKLWMDFAAKTGANAFEIDYFPGGFFLGDVFYRAFPECDPAKETGQLIPPKTQLEISKRVVKYIRNLDMDLVYGVSWGGLNRSFAEAHPERQYLRPGPGFHGQAVNLRVTDPTFEETMTKLWGEAVRELGPADYYFVQYAHEQQAAERYDAYDSAVRVFRKLDPKAKFIFWTWDLDWGRQEVRDPNDRLRIFKERLPKDAVVMDQYVSQPRGLGAKGTENPFERQWYHVNRFGEFHSGDRPGKGLGLRGDKFMLAEAVAAESRIPNGCVGLDLYNELDFGNFLALQLARDLAWNPKRTDAAWRSGEWLNRYALERFGRESAARMAESLRLATSVAVNGNSQMDLRVNVRDGKVISDRVVGDVARAQDDVRARLKDMQALSSAVELALSERERQADNPLYATYLYDLATQGLMDQGYLRFNALWSLAAKDVQSKEVRSRLAGAREYLDRLNDIMASQDRDKLSVTLDRLAAIRDAEKAVTPADDQIATMIATWHYNVISYEKWVVEFLRPFKRALDYVEECAAKGVAPVRKALDAAVTPTTNGEVRPWWACRSASVIREIGKHKPPRSTVELIRDARDRGLFQFVLE